MFLLAIVLASLDASAAARAATQLDAAVDVDTDGDSVGDTVGVGDDAATDALTVDDHASRTPLAPVSIGLGAPLRSTPAHLRDGRFELDLRVIEGVDSDRSRASVLFAYRVDDRLTVGFEAAPDADAFGPLVTYRALDETRRGPSLTFGTSSGRIGTPDGQAWWVTAGKSLEPVVDFPVAPYVGLAWNDFDDEWDAVGGLRIDWNRGISTTTAWDGKSLHHALTVEFENGWRAAALAIDDDVDDETRFGLSIGRTF